VNRKGFTLIEVLLAMSLLAIGMAGILALFATALDLQKQAIDRWDAGLSLSAVRSEILAELSAGLAGLDREDASRLAGAERPVPGEPALRYRVELLPMADQLSGRGYFARIEILARRKGQDRVFDLGWIPIVPDRNNDALIRAMLSR
jgi:prepilin-type N-terminal cleavage/methylation domain-containing protein